MTRPFASLSQRVSVERAPTGTKCATCGKAGDPGVWMVDGLPLHLRCPRPEYPAAPLWGRIERRRGKYDHAFYREDQMPDYEPGNRVSGWDSACGRWSTSDNPIPARTPKAKRCPRCLAALAETFPTPADPGRSGPAQPTTPEAPRSTEPKDVTP